ncbi:MAG: thiamine monophosphate synthase [Adhaeribacter sp.]|nr:thiamine monophosphate synthase [Adhaeribacter sp.]
MPLYNLLFINCFTRLYSIKHAPNLIFLLNTLTYPFICIKTLPFVFWQLLLFQNVTIHKTANFHLAAFLDIYSEKQTEIGVLNTLFDTGLDLLYLRTNPNQEVAWKQVLKNINPEFQNRIIVPISAREVVQSSKLIGHWKEVERKSLQPKLMLPGSIYSTSVHHLPDILDLPLPFRYVFYSPVFESISKPGYIPQYNLKAVKHDLAMLPHEKEHLPFIIGLGGIKAENIKRVHELGFDGAAMMGALWQSPDPVQAFREIMKSLES